MVTYRDSADNAGFTEFKPPAHVKEKHSSTTQTSVSPNMDISNVEKQDDPVGTDHYRSEVGDVAEGSVADSPGESTTADCQPLQTPEGPQAAIDLREHEYKPVVKRRYIKEKLVFVISIVTIVLLSYALLSLHWLLPYYYAVSAPLLIVIRIILYWKNKWQYFLIDFCYFGNAIAYGYIWASPSSEYVFAIIFALSNGPLAWAVGFYRNSMVFHSLDKMTSVYIHSLPPFLTYCIRWFPESVSRHWYRPFVSEFSSQWDFALIWLLLVPFACFFLHSVTYMVTVFGVIKPSEEYQYTYRYLITRGSYARLTNIFGPRFQFVLYHLFYWLYCLMGLVMSMFLYRNFIAHSLFMAAFSLVALWNGATFYMDVFSSRGHAAES